MGGEGDREEVRGWWIWMAVESGGGERGERRE